jgi:hypothetical protein
MLFQMKAAKAKLVFDVDSCDIDREYVLADV